jgi:tripartite-type tricarboxylate transporter receptor subunit TctC
MRRRQLLMLLASGALTFTIPVAASQVYRAMPIRLIVTYPPGGQSDLIARLVAPKLGELLGASIVVENRPGANGTIGVEFAARSPSDGNTLLLAGGGNLILAPVLDSSVRYEAQRDFIPIARIARMLLVLVARSSLPVTAASQLVDYAKKYPGKLTFASSGSLTQLAIVSLKASAGLDIVYVPYKGAAPAVLDIVAGRVDLALADVAVVAPYVRSGALRLIANAGAERARAFRDVPTMVEQGISDFVWESWHGIVAPSATPAAIVARVQEALQKALASTDFRKGLERLGFEPIDEEPEVFPAVLKQETERYRLLVRQAGLLVGP